MAKLVYSAIMSLDGYIADERGNFDWAAPDEEVHRFVNELERPVGTYLYGRLMYETMRYWETALDDPDQPDYARDYARIWQAADKVVYSRTLREPSTSKTRIERDFDAESVRRLKRDAPTDISVGGANLAAEALRAALVDELHLFMAPVLVGSGSAAFPHGVKAQLELLEERRFHSGTAYLRYAIHAGALPST